MSQGVQPPDDQVARVLADGRYLLEEHLGRGGSAEVWRARDTVLDVDRAVKLLIGEGEGRQTLRRRLRDEARAMARLQHPHILRIYDIGIDQGQDYIVMDLADGGSLADLLRDAGPMPPDLVLDYGLQVLSALAAAHAAGIVHRDVKPQNVLLDRQGKAMLADFGIALLSEDAHRKTRTGVAMGSLAYMAPEQRLDARSVGPAADIYAMGTSLYHLLTGDNPVDLFAAAEDSTRWEALPPELRGAVFRATRYEPVDRFDTARDMAMALIDLRDSVGSVPLREPEPTDPTTWGAPSTRLSLPSSETVHEATRFAATWFDHTFDPGPDRQTPEMLAERIARLVPEGPAHAGPTIQPSPPGPTLVASDSLGPPRRYWLIPAVLLLVAVPVGAGWLGLVFAENQLASAPADELPVPEASADLEVEPAEEPEADPGPVADPAGDDAVAVVALPPEPDPDPGPDSDPEPDPEAGPSPLGTWVGSFDAFEFRLALAGSPDDLVGRTLVSFDGSEAPTEVRGHYEPDTRKLVLEDIGDFPTAGTYTATLSESLDHMQGQHQSPHKVTAFTATRVQ